MLLRMPYPLAQSVFFLKFPKRVTEWAAKVVQRCWMTCRERMGFLLHQAAGRPPEEVCPVDASSA
jgi:hypothetical protein